VRPAREAGIGDDAAFIRLAFTYFAMLAALAHDGEQPKNDGFF
jgi:hypothetical protein